MKYDGIETDPRVKHYFRERAEYGPLMMPSRRMKLQHATVGQWMRAWGLAPSLCGYGIKAGR